VSAAADQDAMQRVLAELWTRHRDDVRQSIDDIAGYAAGDVPGDADTDAADVARRAAHRLAGTLGTFGLPSGSELAREIETALDRRGSSSEVDRARIEVLAADLRELVDRFAPETLDAAVAAPAASSPARVVGVCGLAPAMVEALAARTASQQVRISVVDDVASLIATADQLAAAIVDGDTVGPDISPEVTWPADAAPLIVLSGGRRLADRVRAIRRGARRYLQAPTTADVLATTLQSLWTSARRTGTILAVDDDPVVLATLRELLERDGASVVAVDDQEQFWLALDERTPDVVILDVDMPDVNGIELCRVLRADERWQQTGVVFLTGHGDAETVHEVFAAGADDMVIKPIIGPELRARIASRMERTELHRRLAETDGMTGLTNRATAERELEQVAAATSGNSVRPAVAIVDVDHFKRINDGHGHLAGDEVLRQLARLLPSAGGSVTARWGGEEFVVAFERAELAVERLGAVLAELRETSFTDGDGTTFACTFSAGVAELADGERVADWLAAADAALYEAKRAGRNRIVTLPRSGSA
jgi:diguanylate cyclase (GGDEF)-like protein